MSCGRAWACHTIHCPFKTAGEEEKASLGSVLATEKGEPGCIQKPRKVSLDDEAFLECVLAREFIECDPITYDSPNSFNQSVYRT